MAFQRKKKEIRKLALNGELLPWVDSIKHLGTTIKNTEDSCKLDQDLMEKRAAYIVKNNELNQEFYYAHHNTKIWLNNVYNSSFYGAPLWNMFNRAFERLEKTWNTSVRRTMSLPRNTHRYFIELLSGTNHIIKSIWNRFLKFIDNISKGTKRTLRVVLATLKQDTRSTTGNNLRHLKLNTSNFNEKEADIYGQTYRPIPKEDEWRVSVAAELLQARAGILEIGLTKGERDAILGYVCRE